jgi:hypothetical protein
MDSTVPAPYGKGRSSHAQRIFIDRATNERWEELKEKSHEMSGFGKA